MSLSQLTVAVAAAASVTSKVTCGLPAQLSRAARWRASYLTQEGAAGWSGSASVFYICSSQFVEEKKETLRVIYLRTISAVRGGNRQKHLEQ